MPSELLTPTYCVDGVILYQDTGLIVVVQRLKGITGLALPGGKIDPGELPRKALKRELYEETRLESVEEEVFGLYARLDRDPRGHYASIVFMGLAHGEPEGESGKTNVILYDLKTFPETRHLFVFDHAQIIQDYLDYLKR